MWTLTCIIGKNAVNTLIVCGYTNKIINICCEPCDYWEKKYKDHLHQRVMSMQHETIAEISSSKWLIIQYYNGVMPL